MGTTLETDIKIKNAENSWVALDLFNSEVLAEGKTPEEVEEIAIKTQKKFILMFVPKKGETYIF